MCADESELFERCRATMTETAPELTDLGLPTQIVACLFDLDGVLTDTASVHAAAWKEMFDAFLAAQATRNGHPFVPFDIKSEYTAYVDGKTRLDGTRAFLNSRHIALPEGKAGDPSGAETINGLANAKNALVLKKIATEGVTPYAGSIAYLHAVQHAGLRRAVVSSSANCEAVLQSAGIADLFELRVDGVTVQQEHLAGKPAPDTFLAAATALNLKPNQAAVFEDALAGVEAGRAGQFGFVVGVDRVGQTAALYKHGADTVVTDLAQLLRKP